MVSVNIEAKKTVDVMIEKADELNIAVATLENGAIIISGTIKAMIILKDTSGGFVTTEKMLDYRYERSCECDNKKIECTPQVSVSSFECSLKNNEQIDVKAELQINCSVFSETEIDVVSEFSELKESEKLTNSAITVYFPSCEETLWDIAKRYNTTVESIVLENNLSCETTKDIKMLFIPSGTWIKRQSIV